MSIPSLLQILEKVQSNTLGSVRVAIPAVVVAYDPVTQSAEIRPMASSDGEPLPTVPDVPICAPKGGGIALTLPLLPGDHGLLLCTGADLGAWRATGADLDGMGMVSHGLAGAVFLPGVQPDYAIAPGLPRGAFLGVPTGPAVEFGLATIKVTASPLSLMVDDVACAAGVIAVLARIATGAGQPVPTPAEILLIKSNVLKTSFAGPA